jgi:hypothetical protein
MNTKIFTITEGLLTKFSKPGYNLAILLFIELICSGQKRPVNINEDNTCK